jgi:hypothetical protein
VLVLQDDAHEVRAISAYQHDRSAIRDDAPLDRADADSLLGDR